MSSRTIREVTFIVSDELRRIHLLNSKMRLGHRLTDEGYTVPTGDVEAAWEEVRKTYPDKLASLGDPLRLVGAIAADLAALTRGRIYWIEQVTPEVERGRFK